MPLILRDESHRAPSQRSTSSCRALEVALWEELVSGRSMAVGSTQSEHYSTLSLVRRPGPGETHQNSDKQIERLRRQLMGESQKAVALADDCSTSTIATGIGSLLSRMGFKRGLLYVPYLLVRAAHAASGVVLSPCTVVSLGDRWYVSVARPDRRLRHVLSPSECEVVVLMLEGLSNEAIAQRRNVSARTIANQNASVFRKLRISGRMQLLCALVHMESQNASRVASVANDTQVRQLVRSHDSRAADLDRDAPHRQVVGMQG